MDDKAKKSFFSLTFFGHTIQIELDTPLTEQAVVVFFMLY